ncbi:ABC transporter permease [Oligella ureolytica]
MRKLVIPSSKNYRVWQIGILVIRFSIWHIISRDDQLAFFFGEPLGVFQVIWKWFITEGNIYRHLGVTLSATILAFVLGTVAGTPTGLWMGLSRTASLIFEPRFDCFKLHAAGDFGTNFCDVVWIGYLVKSCPCFYLSVFYCFF